MKLYEYTPSVKAVVLFNCDITCCVECTSLAFLDTASKPDVASTFVVRAVTAPAVALLLHFS